jgi:Rieske Fe-S protein
MPNTNRRDFYRAGSLVLGGLIGLVLGIPGVAYLLDPLSRRKTNATGEGAKGGRVSDGFRDLPVTLAELEVGVPRQFPIEDTRVDAWVRYPAEPIGAVWLIRQPEGSPEAVHAFTAECPHLGCAVNLAGDGKGFFCPCHTSAFTFEGKPTNAIPPRPMDALEVAPFESPESRVRVKFARYRTGVEEKIPLA